MNQGDALFILSAYQFLCNTHFDTSLYTNQLNYDGNLFCEGTCSICVLKIPLLYKYYFCLLILLVKCHSCKFILFNIKMVNFGKRLTADQVAEWKGYALVQ